MLMRYEDVPVCFRYEDLEYRLKKDGEPNVNAYAKDAVVNADGSFETHWIGVRRYRQGEAEREVFPRLVDCLYWLYDDEFDDAFATQEQIDRMLGELWEILGDYAMNPATECLEEQFLHFAAGTPREDVWYWFDQNYSKGVHSLLYHGADDPFEIERQRKFLKSIIEFYGEPDEEDKTVYVCYLIVDVENCGTHTEEMQVLRSIGDVAQWWLDQESALEDQAMFPIEQDTLSWMDVISKLKAGSNELNKAVYEWINDKDYDPLNCVQIIVEKHEVK